VAARREVEALATQRAGQQEGLHLQQGVQAGVGVQRQADVVQASPVVVMRMGMKRMRRSPHASSQSPHMLLVVQRRGVGR
jgi:hypothetical protein